MKCKSLSRSYLLAGCCLFTAFIVVAVGGCSKDVPPAAPGPQNDVSQNDTGQSDTGQKKTPETEQPVVKTPDVEPEREPAPPEDPAPTAAPVDIGDLVASLDDAVVFIKSQDALGETVAVGTGCIVDRSGVVATNRHVVADAARAVAQFRDGKESLIAGWVAVDKRHDLVLLKLDHLPDTVESFAPAPVELRQGDGLIAIGHPSEFRFTVTEGIVSALRTTTELPELYQQGLHSNPDTRWVQTTAAISGGSSGGPLMTRKGQLVGLNTWIAAGQNLGFAVHVDHLIELLKTRQPDSQPLPLPETDVISDAGVARIMDDFQKEYLVLVENLQVAQPDERLKIIERQNPIPIYIGKLADYAVQNAATTGEFEALRAACSILRGDSRQTREKFQPIANRLKEHYVNDPRMDSLVAALALASPTDTVKDLLRTVVTRGGTPQVRGTACFSLAMILSGDGGDSQEASPDAIEMLDRAVREYGDVTVAETKLSEALPPLLFRLEHLSINSKAPEIVGTQLNGEPLKLSDYLGKIVVLDFWADWCPHCRVMYPHERELTEKYSADDFAILGVNCDERARAESVMQSGQITWKSWYDGPEGPINQQWQIEGFPTIFVLDRQGIIRFNGVRGPELEEAINTLMEQRLLEMPGDLVAAGESWKYLDDGTDPGSSWCEIDFDDSAWPTGQSPMGYGSASQATTLTYGHIDNKHITTYFRKEFPVEDPATIEKLVLGISVDDAAAVYLNGIEIARMRLPASATNQTPAVVASPDDGRLASLYTADPSSLRAGENLLAVEVHQESQTSADLSFDASLSSQLPDWPPLKNLLSAQSRTGVCFLLRQLGPLATAKLDELKELTDDANPYVRVAAMLALNSIEPGNAELPGPKDEPEKAYREYLANSTNNYFWPIVRSADRGKSELNRAADLLESTYRLDPENGTLCNTVAVAQYRAGQYEKSLASARQSLALQDESPFDYVIVAMSARQLGKLDEASAAMGKLKELMQREKWAGDQEAREFLQEAETLFAGETPGATN